MKEIWKPVKGFEDIYAVSNRGNVKRIDGKYNKYIRSSKVGKGYLRVMLRRPGSRTQLYIHRIVAESFIPNPNDLPCVNHKDGNKQNNHVENLEWCTYSANSQHAWDNGLISRQKSDSAKKKMSQSHMGQVPWNKGIHYSK